MKPQTAYPLALEKHLLLEKGSHWSITGYFIDEDKQKKPVEGNWVVKALERSLQIHLQLSQIDTTQIDTPVDIPVKVLERTCLVFPESPQLFNNWSEQRTPYGQFQGQINVVEDTLLLQLENKQGLRSVEAFLRVFETEYEVRGIILKEDKPLGSWMLELLRTH